MEVEGMASTPEQSECEAGELLDEEEQEEEGQIVDDDKVECERDGSYEAERRQNGGCEQVWLLGDEEGEIIDDEPMEGSSLEEHRAHNHRKRRYSDEERNGSHSTSPVPEDRKSAFEKFRNLSFSKKNPFADGSGRDTRSECRVSRYRPDREGGSRHRRDEIRDEDVKRRDKRYEREQRQDRRDVDDRRNRLSSGRDSADREGRRGYNTANQSSVAPPAQTNAAYSAYGPGSLHERIETFLQAPENQLFNVSDDDLFNKLVELMELHHEQRRFINRREKQLDDLQACVENELDEIDKIKIDLPSEIFANQTNGGNECQNNYGDTIPNVNIGVPPDVQFVNRGYPQQPTLECVPVPPVGQFTAPPPSLPHSANGIRGFQPNVPPPTSLVAPPPHPIPVYANPPPPPFDAARPPPPIVSETIGGISIPHHLLPHSMKPSANSPATNPTIPMMPDFSVPPPGFQPTPMPLHANSPGVTQERFPPPVPGYVNECFARNSDAYNRDRFAGGDRFSSPCAPTPLRNVVPTVQNANAQQTSWSHTSFVETEATNRMQTDSPSSIHGSNTHNENLNSSLEEENHEPVSAPGTPNSAMSAVSEEYFSGSPVAQRNETYDVVSDDEEGSVVE